MKGKNMDWEKENDDSFIMLPTKKLGHQEGKNIKGENVLVSGLQNNSAYQSLKKII